MFIFKERSLWNVLLVLGATALYVMLGRMYA